MKILGAIESGQSTLQTRSQMLRNYKVTQIKTDFPKYFEYERVNELVSGCNVILFYVKSFLF